MIDENQLLLALKDMVSERRFHHSLRVKETASELAERYNVDAKKVRVAAILHDCAKGYSCEDLLLLSDQYKLELDNYTKLHKQLIHAPLGAKIAEKQFKIHDQEILNAICYHTTGRENMSMIEKIICLADYVEPKRSFDGVDEIRKLAFTQIDKALYTAFSTTINYVVTNNYILHPMTVVARNSLLMSIVKQNSI